MKLITALLVSYCITLAVCTGDENGFISFAVSTLSTAEDSNGLYTGVNLPFIREGGTTDTVTVTFRVTNSSAVEDFLSVSNTAIFSDGQSTATGTLVLVNDVIPEGNETFIVEIVDTRFGAEPGSQTTLLLTVQASDEPHGRISFDEGSVSVTGVEPLSGQSSSIQFTVNRGPGVFGRVTASYKVTDGPSLGALDISPTSGQIEFLNGVNSTVISLDILSDDIPENNEQFTLTLSNPGGGALLADTNTQAQLTISSNDVPVRFSGTTASIAEEGGTLMVTVTRGVLVGGAEAGPVDHVTTVQYSTSDGTALEGVDYSHSSGTITFQSGDTIQTISIPILNDEIPEGDETFTITLSNVSTDGVIVSPSFLTAVIEVSDSAGGVVKFQSTDTQTISEDAQTTATFVVERTESVLGTIDIVWGVYDSNDQLAVADFNPPNGTVSIGAGETWTNLTITAFDDTLAEEAEVFTVKINEVLEGKGDLDNETLRVAMLYVADSDDVYGVIQTVEGSGVVTVDSSDRSFTFDITRVGGATGEVVVGYEVVYLPPGVEESAEGTRGVVTPETGSMKMADGVATGNVTVMLFGDAFVDVGSKLYVELVTVELTNVKPLIQPSLSPRIVGGASSVTTSIPVAAASGRVRFSSDSLTLSVDEPDTGFETVTLSIVRDGPFGTATVTWTTITPLGSTFTTEDVLTYASIATIQDGDYSASFDIFISADTVPELDEHFDVQLLAVNELNQALSEAQLTVADVTITKNDKPEGTFVIADVSKGPLFVNEDESLTVYIQRNDGDLTEEQIQFDVVPNGISEFFGSSNIITFAVGQSLSSEAVLTPIMDAIPELNEMFTFQLSAANSDLIGAESAVNITILANDDWNGVFRYTNASLDIVIDEPANPGTVDDTLWTTANFTIVRDRGTFEEALVYWRVAVNTSDATPTSGSVPFKDGQKEGWFTVSATNDQLTEANVIHSIDLSSVVGGGRIDSIDNTASLTITHNDDPISFAVKDTFRIASEGDVVTLRIIRGGTAVGVVTVNFSVVYQTGSANDVVVAPGNGMVTFEDGVTFVEVNVSIVEDNDPELNENIILRLESTTGDAVITINNYESLLTILASDDPHGVFEFTTNSSNVITNEGSTLNLIVERGRGSFGIVLVTWQLYTVDAVTQDLMPAVVEEDFSVVAGVLRFLEGDVFESISLTAIDDNSPELMEEYVVILLNVTEGDLGDSATAEVTIAESDDPYGLLEFIVGDVWVGEDVAVGNELNQTAAITIDRTYGTMGMISVMWEVHPISSPSLPSFVDLMLEGTVGNEVKPLDTPRPYSDTVPYNFTGEVSSTITLPSSSLPLTTDGGFSLSAWVYMDPSVNGIIAAKGSEDGTTIRYGLGAAAINDSHVTVTFYYLPNTTESGYTSVTTTLPLLTMEWQSLIVTVWTDTAALYINGQLQVTWTLTGPINEGEEPLTVGGVANTMLYEGFLQDIRLYSSALSQEQAYEIGSEPAANDVFPVVGVATIPDDSSKATIYISALEDEESEFIEIYKVVLVYSTGQSRINPITGNDTVLTVLKSDYSNGLFGFSSILPISSEEGNNVTILVTRGRGLSSEVTVSWAVSMVGGESAANDLKPTSGDITFTENQTEEMLVVQVWDDAVPELSESFAVTLTSATPNDMYPSTTVYSGAAIDSTLSEVTIEVTANDDPYGIVQFASSAPLEDVTLPIATELLQVDVMESSGDVTVYVVRAQGVFGGGEVEYRTGDGSAVGGVDYQITEGTLVFGSGERVKSFTVTLIDNQVPELDKYFYVNLTISEQDSLLQLGIGKDLLINILPSDDAFGVFSYTDDSLSKVAEEGVASVSFSVFRGSKGSFGDVSVYWEVEGPVGDVTPTSGYVNFTEGQVSADLTLTLNNDMVDELHEVFTITLLSTIGGGVIDTVGGANVAVLTIAASDYPYGLFTFAGEYRPLVVMETSEPKQLTIRREFGVRGSVRVDYMTVMATGLESYYIATEGQDYQSISSGSVTFPPNDTSQVIQITVMEDTLPELGEQFHVILTNATLLDTPASNLGTDALPAVSVEGSNATILIQENGNPSGVVQFSSTSYSAVEGDTMFIQLERINRTLGDVEVTWSLTLGTALPIDVSSLTGTQTIPDGDTSVYIDLSILDDTLPELMETFTIKLESVSPGAMIGSPQSATITIAPSDDPRGLFGFGEAGLEVVIHEPEAGSTSYTLPVSRDKGSIGQATVTWKVSYSSGGDQLDIQPSNGMVVFASNGTAGSIELFVLADNTPELQESFTVTLVSTTSGRIDSETDRAVLVVPANDQPFGTVSLTPQTYLVPEGETDTTVQVEIQRTESLGDVDVLYSVRRSYPYSLDAFTVPVNDIAPLLVYKSFEKTVFDTDDVANECSISCAVAHSLCVAFVVDTTAPLCEVYTQGIGSGNISRPGVIYYQAIDGKLEDIAMHLATPNEDFIAVANGNVTIANGDTSTVVTVTISPDTVPELTENLTIVLTGVSVADSDNILTQDLPVLDDDSLSVIVSIDENDLPYGLFIMHSGQMQLVSVKEGTTAMLTIERMGGAFGEVSVEWNTTMVSSGLQWSELSGDLQGSATFLEGETKSSITIDILDDIIPEGAELFEVYLLDPMGGAVLGGVNITTVTVTIQANDGAAGRVGFAVNSRAVTIMEGQSVSLTVERTVGQSGSIRIYWNVTGSDVERDFLQTTGSLVMAEGVGSMSFDVLVRDDNSSELNETFVVQLTKVEAISTDVGEPSLDLGASTARLTVAASDKPYGEVSFSGDSVTLNAVEERENTLTIVRDFGSFGTIEVLYRAVSMVDLPNVQVAMAGLDFNDSLMTVLMEDGVTGVEITVPVIDDEEPEFSEAFTVEILSASLVSNTPVSVPVGGASRSIVFIGESDSPKGDIQFQNSTFTIQEGVGVFILTVERSQDAISEAITSYQLINVDTSEADFEQFIQFGMVLFPVDSFSEALSITIFDDAIPEVDEEFCVQLFSNDDTITYGPINRTCITIASSDDPYGVFSFTVDSLQSTIQEATENNVNTENMAVFTVTRAIGQIGDVTLPYSLDSSAMNDISPTSDVIVFANGEMEKNIILTAVADSDPELNETFTVSLGQPTAGRLADTNTVANVTVLANQDPFGVLTLYSSDGLPSVSVEEDVGEVTFEIRRTTPSFGEVSVTFSTSDIDMNDGSGIDLEPQDYKEVITTVSMEANQASAFVSVVIVDDATPEIDETFHVTIYSPVGGATLGDQIVVPVTILSNDEAHGRIGFIEDSLSVIVSEREGSGERVTLYLERLEGTIGDVTLQWEVTGDHAPGEIVPSEGEIVFLDGQNSAHINLTIDHDTHAELDEVTMVTLTISDNGVPEGGDDMRGATLIGGQGVAVVTVLANDDPHGVFLWSPATIDIQELEGVNNIVTVHVLREFGDIGAVTLDYRTYTPPSLSTDTMATGGEDYAHQSGTIVFANGQTSYAINITVHEDDIPEVTETFNLVMEGVALVNESDREGSVTDTPRIMAGSANLTVNILANDDYNGILEFGGSQVIYVEENVGVVCIPVVRSRGLFGVVGVEFTIEGVSATGGGVDYSPDSDSVQLLSEVASGCVDITIVNDLVPEGEESLSVTLSTPTGGATLGDNLTVTIIIMKSDDYNGVFTLSTDSLVLFVPEGEDATLTVERTKGSVGVVTVYWLIEESGWSDLIPNAGNVTFADGDTSQSFTIYSIEDNMPEVYESYTLHLSSATGGGRVSSPGSSSIAIPASDEPSGVLGFTEYPLNAIIVQEGDSFTVSVIRSGGTFGSVAMQWELSPSDNTVFTTTSATELFNDGQSMLEFTVETIQDSKAEVARQFDLTIVGAGDASVNSSAAVIQVIVAASDNVHGSVSFSSVSSSVLEDVGVVTVTIDRNGGLVGDIRVNYSADNREAFESSDYTLSTNSLIIAEDSNTGSVLVNIIDDTTPEVKESFVVTINSVELVDISNGGRDFDFAGDAALIDSVPVVGAVAMTTIDIEENDDARGVFSFTSSTLTTTEGTVLSIEVERTQGTFGTPSVHYILEEQSDSLTAEEGVDFTTPTPSSPLVFSVGQSSRFIAVTILDDTEPEFLKTFRLTITGVTNGGSLGSFTQLDVLIAPNDNPYGSVGFSDSAIAGVTIDNPDSSTTVVLIVQRSNGLSENIFVSYTVTGPEPGLESNDITPIQGTQQIIANNEVTPISFTVTSIVGPEPEETFTVTITGATDGVEILDGRTVATITVNQKGQPYGVVTFYAEALAQRVTDESSNISFPIIRNEGTFGSPEIFYTVTGSSDPSNDVYPTSGSVVFQEGQSIGTIELQILADNTPELDQELTLTLTGATEGTIIDPDVFTSSFVIEANESPYGTFGIVNVSMATTPVGGAILRRLSFVIVREYGTDQSVQVVTSIQYEPEPDAGYLPSSVTRVFVSGETTSVVTLDSTEDVYFAPNAKLTVSIVSVQLLSDPVDSDVLPEISPFIGSAEYLIEGGVANPLVGFSVASTQATTIDGLDTNNVILTIERNGTVGGVQISWSVGVYQVGVANGSLTPIVGSRSIGSNESTVTLQFTATPTDPPTQPEVFAVNLFVETLSSLTARVADGRGVAFIEPRGVVKLTYSSFSETEGSTIYMSVSRVFGSMGAITVTGVTMTTTEEYLGTNELAADPITEYPLGKKSIVMEDGQTSGDIQLILPYNSGSSAPKVFTFMLTSVAYDGELDTTPRLATPIQTVPVTIIDQEGGAGVFEFVNSFVTLSEEGSPLAQALVKRTGGLLGTVSVQLIVTEARADGTTPANQIASVSDYNLDSLFATVTFASGEETKPVSIQILDDAIPEAMEYFTLHLQNPQGGKALINTDKDTFEIAITANDNQGGLFTMVTQSLVLNEDEEPQGTLVISREMGLFETIEINWRASYTDGNTHTVALGDLLVEDSGIVIFTPGQSTANFTITLQEDKVPLTSETFSITISSDSTGITFGSRVATVTALPSGFSVFQFVETSRTMIASPLTVSLTVERTKGITLDSAIQYSTEEPAEPVTIGRLTFEPALAGSHFTLVAGDTVFFEPNKGNQSIHISIISVDSIARAFYVNIQTVDTTDSVVNSRAIVVITTSGILSDLYSVYFNAIDASPNTLYSVATDLKAIVEEGSVPGDDSVLSPILLYTLDQISDTVVQGQSRYSNALQTQVSSIYEMIASDSSYTGRSDVSQSLATYANSLLSGYHCNNESVVVSQTSYIIRASRSSPANLHTLDLRTTDNDMILLPNTNLEVSTECINVVFVAYSTSNLFSGSLLGNKIVTISLWDPSVTKLNAPLKYRITSPNGNVFPSTNSCLIWRTSEGEVGGAGYWDSSLCSLAKTSIVEANHIECECQMLGEFAVATPPNYGWTLPGPISCAFVVLAMIAVVVLHVYYFRRIQLATRILIMLCITIAIFELIALVDMVVSVDISASGCVSMGILMQLFVVSVFVWMLVLIVSLWLNLMNFTSGQEPLIIYIFISWGLSAAIVIATILLSIYTLSMTLEEIYGRVGELCFIPSFAVAGVSTAIPIVLAVLVVVGMLSHSCVYWTRWEDIKSLYKDTYNKRDIPLLLIFYLLIIMVALFGGLHLYLQQIYLFFVFFGFNVILGIYSLVVYAFMSWHTLTWKHKHYPIKEEVQPLSIPEEPELNPLGGDLYGSRQSLIPRYQPSGGIAKSRSGSLTGSSHLPLSTPPTGSLRKPHPPSSSRLEEIREEGSDMRSQVTRSHMTRSETSGMGRDSDSELGNYEITHESDGDSQMDDILYALRTGGGSGRGHFGSASQQEEDDDLQPLVQEMGVVRRSKPSSDQYRMRRISIADTHL